MGTRAGLSIVGPAFVERDGYDGLSSGLRGS